MGASIPEIRRRLAPPAGLLLACGLVLGVPGAAAAQTSPVLKGSVAVGDSALTEGTVVLHEVTGISQDAIDSTAVRTDGSFSFALPATPDSAAERFFFASVRHDGVLYFGAALMSGEQLDSIYRIQAYDTIVAPADGFALSVQRRNIFIEPGSDGWSFTDVIEILNDRDRTMVARDDGRVWSYPLPEGARDFASGQGELSLDGTSFENGLVSFRAAIAPGVRAFVLRYRLDDPFVTIPSPGTTGEIDVLVREPATDVAVEGLDLRERVELEPGSTYRRYGGGPITGSTVKIVEARASRLPVRWISIVLAMVLAATGLLALRRGAVTPARAPPRNADRRDLMVQVARLDESFHADPSPSASARATYEKRRAELMRRLRAGS